MSDLNDFSNCILLSYRKTEQLRSINLDAMKKDSEENLCSQIKSLQNQMKSDIEMVTKRLDAEKNEAKINLQVNLETKKQVCYSTQ